MNKNSPPSKKKPQPDPADLKVTQQSGETIPAGRIVTSGKTEPPETVTEEGQTAVSGHMPDPESDDNVTDTAHEPGLYTETADNEAHEVDVAEEVEEAERDRRGIARQENSVPQKESS